MIISALRGDIVEWDYLSDIRYADPFNEIELEVIVENGERTWRLPAFWRGDHRWSVRFRPSSPGTYTLRSRCSDTRNPSLHDVLHTMRVEPSETPSPEGLHIATDKSRLQQDNGTPFLWLGDTWWMGLSDRLPYPEAFRMLALDRKEKGFNVIMIVAGLYPDMDAFDPRAANVSGFVWEEGFERINPAFFDEADKRISYLVAEGFIPCIVGAWGYYLLKTGIEKMRKHWEYIIARWAAYPVVWCAAGEATMPYYLSPTPEADKKKQKEGWTQILRFIRKRDPFRRPVTIHPIERAREETSEPDLLDFELLQASHNGYESIFRGVELIGKSLRETPKMPVVMGEINYEGIIHDTSAEMQRFAFWSGMLSGACGFTYGANGIWQVNTQERPFGASPHGGCWGNTPWSEAMTLQGAYHVGLAKRFLQTLPWETMRPQPDTIVPAQGRTKRDTPYVAGIEGKLYVLYFYGPVYPWDTRYRLRTLNPDSVYEAFFWDPRTARRHPLDAVTATEKGEWEIPSLPTFEDWVLVLREDSTLSPSKTPVAATSFKRKLQNVLRPLRHFGLRRFFSS